MNARSLSRIVGAGLALALWSGPALAQTLAQQAARMYRPSVVFLSVNKITNTGAVVQEFGTGFVVTGKGHVLTSCHVVDSKLLDQNGKPSSISVDKVEVSGAMASRAGTLEPMSFLRCAQGGLDLALLKFKDTSKTRRPIPVAVYAEASVGDPVASMGFPLDTEFFVRQGLLGGETDDDRLTVDMTMNPGDSGGPVLNSSLRVMGVAEAGYTGGAHIGIARPIRHGYGLLTEAGVVVTAVNANINSTPDASASAPPKVEVASPSAAFRAFVKAVGAIPAGAETAKVTYPVSRQFAAPEPSASGARPTPSALPRFTIADFDPKPGYRIVDAKFVVTAKEGVDVVSVNPMEKGNGARAVLQKVNEFKFDPDKPSFIRGYVETTQVKINP